VSRTTASFTFDATPYPQGPWTLPLLKRVIAYGLDGTSFAGAALDYEPSAPQVQIVFERGAPAGG
jgi:hypothetical protein